MILFKILWIVDALAALIALYFFVIGLADGTVSSRNIGLWLLIVGLFAGILPGSTWLRNHQHTNLSVGLLLIIAIPALGYLIFILLAIFGNQRWN